MGGFIIRIFDYIRAHRLNGVLLFIVLTAVLAASVGRVRFKEDISDFLPLDEAGARAMDVYQRISGASRIVAVFQTRDGSLPDPDEVIAAVDLFTEAVAAGDSAFRPVNVTSRVDMEQIFEVSDFVYDNVPYFLEESDYRRMDSLLAVPGYMRDCLEQDKRTLMSLGGGIASRTIAKDPLGLFSPVGAGLQTGAMGMKFEMCDGYIFSGDMSRAIVTMESPFGSSETEMNSKLVDYLGKCSEEAVAEYGNLEVHLLGGPVIAVGNSSRIKADSIWSVALALLLIIPLLYISFRNLRNIGLIVLSIGWGWLFALGALAVFHNTVSAIVVGISSAILGIAANYPLHLIAHLSHNTDRRKALKEIVTPLVVGNITTVGAFMALVPLDSVSLRDLGLFSSFLLVGTIIFVLVFLPHLAKPVPEAQSRLISYISDLRPEKSRFVVVSVLVLTVVFAYFSLGLQFDSNISNINYMSSEQKADMEYFQETVSSEGNLPKVYVISSDSSLEAALDKSIAGSPDIKTLQSQGLVKSVSGCGRYVPSTAEQKRRLERWNNFVSERGEELLAGLKTASSEAGFTDEAFDDFRNLLSASYEPLPVSSFDLLATTVFASNIVKKEGAYDVVDVLSVEQEDVPVVEEYLSGKGLFNFDIAGVNSSIANNLSDDFNYIGWACGFIVFFFLWLSFGSLELAVLSFIPMAVSWLWILGIMSVLGMKFNIVNVILATFIFGQGDDYTIFMTEGACSEYTYRRRILGSYKKSIVISALIMFAGIGTLIVAKHPAMHSLGEVTIVGMLSVVLMAYLFPPLVFDFLVRKNGELRTRPLYLAAILRKLWFSLLTGLFKGGWHLRLMPWLKVRVDSSCGALKPGTKVYCGSVLERIAVLSVFPEAEITEDVPDADLKIFGASLVLPDGDCQMYAGSLVLAPLAAVNVDYGDYYRALVVDRYRYKETEVFKEASANMKRGEAAEVSPEKDTVWIENEGYGEASLLYALEHPEITVIVNEPSEDKRLVLKYCAEGVAPNLIVKYEREN